MEAGGESMSFEKFEFFGGRNDRQNDFLEMKVDVCEGSSPRETKEGEGEGEGEDGDVNYSDSNDNTKSANSLAHPDVPAVLTNSFLSMENSNNAIDNNICHANASEHHSARASPVFKLPNSELTFNGTLGRLKSFEPLVGGEERDPRPKKIDSFQSIFAQNDGEPSDGFDKAVEESAAKSPNAQNDDSKSTAIPSSNSQYPSDYDAFPFNVASDTPSRPSTAENSVDLNASRSSTLNASAANENFENDSLFGKLDETGSEDAFDKPAYSPSLFSDDGEDGSLDGSGLVREADERQKLIERDKKFVKRLENSLRGVPPPPSFTTTQFTASEILQLYQTNLPKFNRLDDPVASDAKSRNGGGAIKNDSTSDMNEAKNERIDASVGANDSKAPDLPERLLIVNATEERVVKEPWPNLLSLRYYDLYYNYSNYSEEADALLSRYVIRYVGCETSSSCVAYPLRKSPMKKSLRSNVGKSPGRRLSHLARRKITFCNADNVKTFTTKKQVLIDQRRYASLFSKNQTLRRSPRKRVTPKKTPLKKTKTPKKKTPGSSQKKRNVRQVSVGKDNIPKNLSAKESSKRALFLSPERSKPKPIDNAAIASTSKVIRSKRALFVSPAKTLDIFKTASSTDDDSKTNKKRRLDESSDSEFNPRVKIQKSLSFGGDKIETSQTHIPLSKHASEHGENKTEVLADLRKKKLLWAVTEALRTHSIGVKHEKFSLHLKSLARLTRKISQLPKYARYLRTPGNSTIETLSRIARQHAFLVIRGKSIDEIFTEEQIKQSEHNNTKLTGYIPINGYDKDKQSVKNNENSHDDNISKVHSSSTTKIVLQDKTIALNIESNSVDKSSTMDIRNSHSSDSNSKMRACRNLNFDTDSFVR